MSTLLDELQANILLGDGAIGTELLRRGLPEGAPAEAWNLERPDALMALHGEYRAAGAQVLTTNSFCGSAVALARYGLDDRAPAINEAAARLAVEAAEGRAWVLGSVGPCRALLEQAQTYTPERLRKTLREQVRALLAGGVDAVLVETFSAVEEMSAAVEAAHAAGAAIVVASMSFRKTASGYVTLAGVSLDDAVDAMEAVGVEALGSNCGVDLTPEDHAAIVEQMRRRTRLPLLVQPNAGTPQVGGGETRYPLDAATLAAALPSLVQAGANLIGGCCGTGPEYVRRLAELLPRCVTMR